MSRKLKDSINEKDFHSMRKEAERLSKVNFKRRRDGRVEIDNRISLRGSGGINMKLVISSEDIPKLFDEQGKEIEAEDWDTTLGQLISGWINEGGLEPFRLFFLGIDLGNKQIHKIPPWPIFSPWSHVIYRNLRSVHYSLQDPKPRGKVAKEKEFIQFYPIICWLFYDLIKKGEELGPPFDYMRNLALAAARLEGFEDDVAPEGKVRPRDLTAFWVEYTLGPKIKQAGLKPPTEDVDYFFKQTVYKFGKDGK